MLKNRRSWAVFAWIALAGFCAGAWLAGCEAPMTAGDYRDYIGPNLAATRPATQPATGPASWATTAPAAALGLPQGKTLELTRESAIVMALANNPSLAVERYNPDIFRTAEQVQRAAFDPDLQANVTGNRQRVHDEGANVLFTGLDANVLASIFLPTGTTVAASLDHNAIWDPEEHAQRAGLSVTQALLRGGGIEVNLASLRQARLDTRSSEYELRGFAESLTAQVEQTYWHYALAARQIEIFTDSLKVAQKQLEETQERINVGKLAETELAAAQAEVALRKEDLIQANSTLAKTRLQLLQLLNPPGGDLWQRELVEPNLPQVPPVLMEDVESHVKLALQRRPDLNQARLAILRGDLDLVKTRNGLLPQLNAFIALGKTGYADTFAGSAFHDWGGRSFDAQAGASFELPPLNRAARAQNQAAELTHDQDVEALFNLEQLAQVDVRNAYIQVNTAAEQIAATTATRRFQEEKLRAEVEKFNVGKSTSFLVAQAQRDLLSSQILEVQAVVSYLNAHTDLYRLEGTLLDRRGIVAPGRETVKLEEGVKGR